MKLRISRVSAVSTLTLAACCGAASGAVVSTFDAGDEGWRIVDLTLPADPVTPPGAPVAPVFQAIGGHPGGFIEFTDPSDASFYFQAPAAYVGDQSAAYGSSLAYEQFTTPTTPAWRDDPDVILVGAGQALVYQGAANPGLDWTSFSVPLSETGWHKVNLAGAEPTATEFQSVLASLTAVRIRGEYVAGVVESTGLDNVQMAAVPEPPTYALALCVAAACLMRARQMREGRHRTAA
jgi:hypothetical protein